MKSQETNYAGTLFCAFLFLAGCGKPIAVDVVNWSPPQAVSQSRDSLDSGFDLHKWNNTVLAVNGDTGSAVIYFLQDDGKTWREQKSSSPKSWLPLSCDPKANRFIVSRGKKVGDKMDVNFLIGSIGLDGSLLISMEKTLPFNVETFFGKPSPGVAFSRRTATAVFARSEMVESNIGVTYSIVGDNGSGRSADGPFANGIFLSSDSGHTWQKQQVSDFDAHESSFCKTRMFNYFFSGRDEDNALCYSRSPSDREAWTSPDVIVRTFGTSGFIRCCIAASEEDTAHLCWLDRRHEKKRLNPLAPNRANYEVAYCHRKDSDASWSKDVILSGGLLYSYTPSMSVEGDNIVVVWAGVQNGKDGQSQYDPSDIYYVTSKDGGKIWTKPMKITDGFKAGITSGRPQVALHKGVIHLFYIQGKLNYKKTGGMVKLNQPPWPILYQQRPFRK